MHLRAMSIGKLSRDIRSVANVQGVFEVKAFWKIFGARSKRGRVSQYTNTNTSMNSYFHETFMELDEIETKINKII